jgi:hypothetical protein
MVPLVLNLEWLAHSINLLLEESEPDEVGYILAGLAKEILSSRTGSGMRSSSRTGAHSRAGCPTMSVANANTHDERQEFLPSP